MADIYLAAAIVIHDDHVLIVRRSRRERFLPGAWGVPCGKLDTAESAQHAVVRELREETGLLGKVLGLGGSLMFKSEFNGREVCNRQSNFLVRPLTLAVSLPEPDQEYRWLSTARLGDGNLDAHNISAIRQGLSVASDQITMTA